ncbi:MAG TPA: hypothetical protein VHA11_12355 [Bryobacteraceae bacterium]|nr:hypothetical protein [Bryobacteraceae bacterium]
MHPADETLALYAGKELGLWARLRVAQHVRSCERCGRHVEEFRDLREFLEAEREELPCGVDWGELAGEMRANIRLGLAAGRCVAQPDREPIRLPWRTPAVALPVLLLVLLGWILQTVPPPVAVPLQARVPADAVVLDGGAGGIGVAQAGRGFRLMHPRAAQNITSSIGGDSIGARYVDADTGQVTISHVYYAE